MFVQGFRERANKAHNNSFKLRPGLADAYQQLILIRKRRDV